VTHWEVRCRELKKTAKAAAGILLILAVVFCALVAFDFFNFESLPYDAGGEYAVGEFDYSGNAVAGLFTGFGSIRFENNDTYEGTFAEGRFNGDGVYTSSEGWVFRGVFAGGKPLSGELTRDGETIRFEDAEAVRKFLGSEWSYEGSAGERGQNGYGIFTFENGYKYAGSFRSGLADGADGRYTSDTGALIYQGDFAAGVFSGEGKYCSPDGSFTIEGTFADGLPNGHCVCYENGELRYDGEFLAGLPNGQGVYYSPDGWVYTGGFQGGAFHGSGTIVYEDGKTVSGLWESGVQVSIDEQD